MDHPQASCMTPHSQSDRTQGNDARNEDKDIEEQCPSKVVEFVSKTKFQLFFRALAVPLDPLFFYVPVIKEDKKCIGLNKELWTLAFVSRSVIDVVSLVCFAVKSMTRCDERNDETNTTRWAKWQRHLRFMLHVLVILPIPQVVLPIIFSDMRRTKPSNITILNSAFLLQYGLRVFQSCRYGKKLIISEEDSNNKASLWLNTWNLFLYILAGHVLGAFWYFFSAQRLMACWHKAYEIHGRGFESSFGCDHGFRNLTFIDDFCPIDTPNPRAFDFGIFLEARRSGILESTSFLQKVLYCFSWGMRNLSCFGSNLQTSSYIWENIFALGISINGLLLFLYFTGNLQMDMEERRRRPSTNNRRRVEE